MKMRPRTRSARAAALTAAALCVSLIGCQQPDVGDRATAVAASEGPRIALEDAWLDLHDHPVATFSVTLDGLPLRLDEVKALDPRFTLATLSAHPVDGLSAWRSQLLTGTQTAAQLPPSGPGTPPGAVLSAARQPGSETPATLLDLGGGRFRYVFTGPISPLDPDETVRVGVWLRGAPAPSLRTSSTFDFRPSGGPVDARELVSDATCNGCHGNLVLHGTRTGVRLCLTCHTWQNADPDTIDPASMSTTAQTDPNPLELGRLVHRIHRGKNLPTLYRSSSQAVPAPALAAGNDLPLPFSPENSVTPIVGRKFSIVGHLGSELVPGRVVQRAEGGLGPTTAALGIVFPRDLRDCAACHAGAAQAGEAKTAISRRTCAGCHPDVWFGTAAITDQAHLAHPGGPQADDASCADCHIKAPSVPTPGIKLYAPVELAHVPPGSVDAGLNPRSGRPEIEIVRVAGLRPGSRPVVTFRLLDRNGPVVPAVTAPVPLWEPDSATSSFVPRSFAGLSLRLVGPTSPDYAHAPVALISSGTSAGNPDPLLLTTTSTADEYVYTFSSVVPASASGTWALGMEGRRRLKYGHYDKAKDLFLWPYTGETVTESPDNPVVYVDTTTGIWPPDGPAPRRKIIAEQNCLRCHGRFQLHGGQRHQVEWCLFCHTPSGTDWAQRPKVSGSVSLAGTWDGIEERSIHFKVMVHRIHTGGRTGAATLEGIAPHVIYGNGGRALFFDEGLFPNDLRNCTACHSGKTYLVDAVPAGAPATVANETGTVRHAGSAAHVAGEAATPPIQAACLGCHANGGTIEHARSKTVGGVETCTQCHSKGSLSVEVVHGLAPPSGTVGSSFSAIAAQVLVPRCASTACHAAGATPPQLDAAGAYAALVGVPSGQSSLAFVQPGAPERSYLVFKLRGDAASAGGSVATIMPTDGALSPSEIAAIEAWITNGAPND